MGKEIFSSVAHVGVSCLKLPLLNARKQDNHHFGGVKKDKVPEHQNGLQDGHPAARLPGPGARGDRTSLRLALWLSFTGGTTPSMIPSHAEFFRLFGENHASCKYEVRTFPINYTRGLHGEIIQHNPKKGKVPKGYRASKPRPDRRLANAVAWAEIFGYVCCNIIALANGTMAFSARKEHEPGFHFGVPDGLLYFFFLKEKKMFPSFEGNLSLLLFAFFWGTYANGGKQLEPHV